jgi:hypothetical protein
MSCQVPYHPLSQVNKVDTLRYLITMMDDLVAENDVAVPLMIAAASR